LNQSCAAQNDEMKSSSGPSAVYTAPPLSGQDRAVLGEIHRMRRDLRRVLRTPKRWEGGLRRSALARAIQGSNSIEGYTVAEDDAAAALDDDEPIGADEKTFLEIQGYRAALGYTLVRGEDDSPPFDATEISAMHYMMLRHETRKSPGRYRRGAVSVYNDRQESVVYEGPDAGRVPALMDGLVESLNAQPELDPVVRSAMAHLNLVMIHPFRDGNGRMARALATSVLVRSEIGEPEFASIEEWLGRNTEDYYSVLAHTGRGSWNPRPDADLWLSFNLRAHHMQAQTVRRRIEEAGHTWSELDRIVEERSVPERAQDALFEAVLGYRVRRAGYIKRAGVGEQTATRDLSALASAGLLVAHGAGRGRFYTAGEPLARIRESRRAHRTPLHDPYPWMRPRLAEPVAASAG
jgi:Fic family protein